MKYFRKLVGDKCYLSPVSLEDAERYTEWVNDLEIGQFVLFATQIYDVEREREALKHLMNSDVVFAIIEKDTNKVIGNCGLHGVNEVHRRASFGIFIGEKTYWNQGIGAEATALILDYGFNILNLKSISLEVVSFNKRAVKCYEKVGFKLIGTRRKAAFMAGEYHDVLLYDILADEFESPYVRRVFEYAISEEAGRSKITIA
ncbi:MAG: GNAT family protein [Candidatus Cloacimonetes bacterium]|jgi:RimJ/RimL family protein N-acetyltransferase|nr:GNAT family N-acetyltransferase [Candidatus Cloacimonadota bacterium]MDY0336988.1 GNAT family protein [Candidatus Cloacimonadaceae bacterium]MCB5269738.1 GNAT family N-acetyltransferase [Candidatus Cloacimonadota bacterium]MCK9334918.1 GNAT family N-acetyltransferase [Candidatus Cloacimonadota bacterium]MDD2542972.1 GNAT family protein [Candidatus Cloacimonadota bacterium]